MNIYLLAGLELIILCFIWTLFVLGTSIAWNLGQHYINFQMAKQFQKWMREAKKIHDDSYKVEKDWGIENPNDDKNENRHKKSRR